MIETLFINGVDIKTIVPCLQVIDGFYDVSGTRGENLVFPGVNGETWVEKPVATGQLPLGLVFTGDNVDTPTLNAQYRKLKLLVRPGKLVQMVRRMSYPGTGSGYEDHNAPGEYLSGLAPTIQALVVAKMTLTMKVLSGLWYGAFTTVAAPGTIFAAGEESTSNMTITMGAGTLRNTTTGDVLTYSGPGIAVIDVLNLTAAVGSLDTTQYLAWTRKYPFSLQPGGNIVTWAANNTLMTGASLHYAPAYY